ncbi:MAG: DUF3313 family protein [Bdellovibrionales bacterium]|nr:DUF3313 family protein [Bdellovibrionales bacterium]
MLRKNFALFALFVLSLVTLASCAFKAAPAETTAFLDGPQELDKDSERYPFHEVWISESYLKRRAHYDKLILKPVNLEFLFKTEDWKHVEVFSNDDIKEEATKLGGYLLEAFNRAFDSEENTRYRLVDVPDSKTLALEVAIVELVPTDVVRNAAGNVIGFLVPGGGLVSAGSGGVIATEGIMTDALTGEVLAKFKDRESAKIRPVDVAGLSAFSFARETIDDWAYQSMKLFNTPVNKNVSDSSAVTLAPW